MGMITDGTKRTVFIEVLKNHLEEEIKATLINDLAEDFKKKIGPEIKEMVENVSFERIELLKSHLDLDEHLNIYIKWRGEPGK